MRRGNGSKRMSEHGRASATGETPVVPVDVRPCSNIRFEPMPRTMLYGDTTRLGRPFAKDPTVIRHNGKSFMYYSECGYA